MKLRRLSNPTTHSFREHQGEEVITTHVTSASQFDMLPAWAQWLLISITVGLFGALGYCIYLQRH